MAEIVKMPKLSDTMTDGVIAKWHKKVGDIVKSGELLADIETDKATMEFESFQDGVLLHIGVPEKGNIAVDGLIAILGKKGEDITPLINQSTSSSKNTTTIADVKESVKINSSVSEIKPLPKGVEVIRMPKLSDTMTDGVVAQWHKKVGDKIKSGDLLADIETDKATMEFESFQDGVLIYIGVESTKSAPVDSVLAILGQGKENVQDILSSLPTTSKALTEANVSTVQQATAPIVQSTQTVTAPKKNNSSPERIKISPLAKTLAKEKNINLSNIQGSGDGGRIIKKDIEQLSAGGVSIFSAIEGFTDMPVSQMRKTIAKRLLESKNGAPHYYLMTSIDMDNAIAARQAINLQSDTKISFNDIVIKASAAALRKHPKVNSAWLGTDIRQYKHIHIGVAVAVEDGLLVPVIRFADQLSLSQISSSVKDLGKRAKEKKLQPADWEGNTFTISNLGMFGISEFTSIINSPESCILSVGAIQQVPVIKNNLVVPGNIMKLTLACDHRSVDGAVGAAFLQTLKHFLENPITMFV